MTFNHERDPRRNPNERHSGLFGRNNVLPLIVAAAIAVALIAMMYPRTTTERVSDTINTGPSVRTVAPTLSPTTEPPPTQAPQP
jgi:hypothetical protein